MSSVTLPFEQIDTVFGERGPNLIAEIGAADGLDTTAYARRYPKAEILAFEPLKRNVDTLNHMIRDAEIGERVVVYPIALGDENKVGVDFWESRGAPLQRPSTAPWPYSSSLLPPAGHSRVHPWCKFEKTTTSVCRFEDLTRAEPDYAHIDVQGFELAVLRGFGERLKTVRAVWMEVSSVELYDGQPLYEDVGRFMRDAGFVLMIDTALGRISGDQFWQRG